MRLIDADAAIDALKELTANGTNKGMVFGEDAVHRIEMLPTVQPDTTTHDSISAKTGKNDGDGTSGDYISRQAVTKFLNDWLSCLFENCHKQSASDLKMIIKDFKNLPSAQSELEDKIREIGYTGKEGRIYIGGRLFAVRELPQ